MEYAHIAAHTGRIRNCQPCNPADKTNDPKQIAVIHVHAPPPRNPFPWPLAMTTPLFDAKMPTTDNKCRPAPLIHQNSALKLKSKYAPAAAELEWVDAGKLGGVVHNSNESQNNIHSSIIRYAK